MKYFVALLFSLSPLLVFSQTEIRKEISDSGKLEFKRQAEAEKPDYTAACRILGSQVKQYPNNAELHYFLGYAIDRLNSVEGSTMHQMKKNMTIEASAQFEMVNKLQPEYTGEFIVLDPYSKISSIWGSLAQSYFIRGEEDSARWAFTEGKKRGGFIEPILHLNRQLLNSCSKNAILITEGDNITIPAWYLQTVENFRTDITLADANLINTSWYCRYLKNVKKLDFGFTDEELERINHIEFEKRFITITNPNDSTEKFTWELKPTYYNKYLLKGDRMMLGILKENLFSRDIYFGATADTTTNLFLGDHLNNEGLVSKIRLKGINFNIAPDHVSDNFSNFSIEKLRKDDILKSKDAIFMLNNYRWAYYQAIARLLHNNQKPKAKQLKNEMIIKFPLDKLPFAFEKAAGYFEKLFSEIDKP